jgi:hypothetical protein
MVKRWGKILDCRLKRTGSQELENNQHRFAG